MRRKQVVPRKVSVVVVAVLLAAVCSLVLGLASADAEEGLSVEFEPDATVLDGQGVGSEADALPAEDEGSALNPGDEPKIVAAASNIASGYWGTCPWEISSDGTLTIHPGYGESTDVYRRKDLDIDGDTGDPYEDWSPWAEWASAITAVKAVEEDGRKVTAPPQCKGLFRRLWRMTNADLRGMDVSGVTNMSGMFYNCPDVATIDFTGWDTSSVTDMSDMFGHLDTHQESCLESLDLSCFDTSSVTDMGGMFSGCVVLKSLNISNWDTSSVTDMRYMFYDCGIESLDLSAWNTSSVINYNSIFKYCFALKSINLNTWNTSSAVTINGMFTRCISLTSIDLSHWDTSHVESMQGVFSGCAALRSVDISGWDTSLAANTKPDWTKPEYGMDAMFSGCTPDRLRVGRHFVTPPDSNDLSHDYIPESNAADGRWWSESEHQWFTRSEVAARQGIADTYLSSASPAGDITNAIVTVSAQTYTGSALKPAPTVKLGSTTLKSATDYTVAYSNNTNVGTATVTVAGQGKYSGTATGSFKINAATLSGATIASIADQTYTGGAIKPTPTVKMGSTTLKSGTDYTVSYGNNTSVGTATVTVTGKGNYTGTKSATFKIVKKKKSSFAWGVDNWNFDNSSAYFKGERYIDQINSTYLSKLRSSLTGTDYEVIFTGKRWYDGSYTYPWIYEEWGGSCYGMSSTSLLAKEGLLPYSSYQSGATSLYQLGSPYSSSSVGSLITYYQMLQVKEVIQQQYRTVPKRSNKENIQAIISALDSHSTVLVGFKKDGWGGHAILAYGYEYGSWTWNGVSYGGHIKVCDPNASRSSNSRYDIYFNTSSYNWAIPAYSPIRSTYGAVFNYVGASVGEINQGGYLNGAASARIDDYVARLDAVAVSENRSVSKVSESSGGSYVDQANAPGDIEEDVSYVSAGEGEGTPGYNLRDAESAYRVRQGESRDLKLIMRYEDCCMSAGSSAGSSAIFDKSGYVEVNGEASDYAISMTFDEGNPTDWFTVSVLGSGATKASVEKVDRGYVLSGSKLSKVRVDASNKNTVAHTEFSTSYKRAFIYEINESTIGVSVDKDGNGSFETVIANGSSSGSASGTTVESVIEAIAAIPDVSTLRLSDEPAVTRARKAYDSLTSDQKAEVGEGMYRRLTEAEARLKSLRNPYFLDADPTDDVSHGLEVDWMGTSGISTGWEVPGGREFRGMRDVTRCDFAAFLYRLADLADNGRRDDSIKLSGAKVKSVLAGVSDCTEKTSHAAEIAWLVDSGISKGWADKGRSTVSFRPMAKVARQDMAAFLYRFADIRDDGLQNRSLRKGAEQVTFSDVKSGDEANHAFEVQWLASIGVTKGWDMKNGTFQFRGTKTVARQDMAAFMYRLNGYLRA